MLHSVSDSLLLFARIVYIVIAPIFLLMGVGFVVQRKLGLDIRTLTRLNFWIFVPVFLFVHFTESSLSGKEFALIAGHFAVLFGAMFALTWWTAKFCGYEDRLRRAMTASVLFYNSGNYGVPAAALAFAGAGVAVQAFVILLQNFTNFTVGLGLHAGAGGMKTREQFKAMLRLPMIYVFVLAVAWRVFSLPLPTPIKTSLHLISDGMVPIALVTFGAQMANLESYRLTRAMALTVALRLLVAPFLGFCIVCAMGLHGVLAQALIVSTSFPTAVNAALLAIEFDNEPEFSSAVVFYTTLASMLTVSLVIFLVKNFVP